MYTDIKIALPLVLCCLTSFRIFKTDHLTFHALRPNIVETILGLKVNTYWGDLICYCKYRGLMLNLYTLLS